VSLGSVSYQEGSMEQKAQQLTDRQRRERTFYDEYEGYHKVTEVSFDPVDGLDRRPWNSYWFIYESIRLHFSSREQRLLDFGCGSGLTSTRFARLGYEVFGFDISHRNIDNCEALARKYGLEDRTHYSLQVAEKLDYPDAHFDVVVGLDILHHVEIGPAIEQCRRVLKPGGLAIFREHKEVPVLDRIRNTELVQRLVPKDRSFERHITDDEHKLSDSELQLIKRVFPEHQIWRFDLFSRADQFISRLYGDRASPLQLLDYFVINAVPSLGELGGTVVFAGRK
jgi:2-polyprenyl-3-methyl-5-hydroxy-6-metoxy-1,4-benzoquinol methylase